MNISNKKLQQKYSKYSNYSNNQIGYKKTKPNRTVSYKQHVKAEKQLYDHGKCKNVDCKNIESNKRVVCQYVEKKSLQVISDFCIDCKCESKNCPNQKKYKFLQMFAYSHFIVQRMRMAYCDDCECDYSYYCESSKVFVVKAEQKYKNLSNDININYVAQKTIYGDSNLIKADYCHNHKCKGDNCANKRPDYFTNYCKSCTCIIKSCDNPKLLPNLPNSDHYYCTFCLDDIFNARWTTDLNWRFPKSIQLSIKSFLLVNKRYQWQYKLKIPKFVLFEIFKFVPKNHSYQKRCKLIFGTHCVLNGLIW